MPIFKDLQPKEIEYLKYLKGKGIDAKSSFTRLEWAKKKWLFWSDVSTKTDPGSTIPSTTPKEPVTPKKSGILESMRKWIKPLWEVFTKRIPEIWSNIKAWLGKFWADIHKIKSWELDRWTWTEPWLLWRTAWALQERWKQTKEALQDYNLWKQWIAETFYQVWWQNVKWIVDVFWDTFMSTLSTLAPEEAKEDLKKEAQKLAGTEWGEFIMWKLQQAKEDMDYLKENDPEAYRNFAATFWYIEWLAELTGLDTAKRWLKTWKEAIEAWIRTWKKTGKELIDTWLGATKKTWQEIVEKTFKTKPLSPKIKTILKDAKKRIELWPQEFKWVVWKKPKIWPTPKEIPKKDIKIQQKKIDSLNKAFTPMQKVRQWRVVRPQEKIDQQWWKIIDDFDKKDIQPKDMKEFRSEMIKWQQDIYKVINPALEKSKVKIDLDDTVSSAFREISPEAGTFSPWQVKQIDNIVNWILDNPRYKKMDMEKLEEVKQFINSITDFSAKWQDKVLNNFLRDLTWKIWDLQDDVLWKIEWESTIKDLKRTYWAYSDMLWDVNKSIIKYDRKAPIWLFSGLWRIAWVWNIIESAIKWDIPGALKGWAQIVTWEVIKNINDANKIIKRTFGKKWEFFSWKPKPLKIKPKLLPPWKTTNAKRTVILPSKKAIKLWQDVKKSRPKTTDTKSNFPVVSTKKKPLELKEGTRITPQTKEKAVIIESKKGLEKTKFWKSNTQSEVVKNTDLSKQLIKDTDNIKDLEKLKDDIKDLNLPREKELLKELDNKMAGIKSMDIIEDIPEQLQKEYWDDIIKSFRKVYSDEQRTILTKWWDKYTKIEFLDTPNAKKLSRDIQEYINKNPWEADKTVQEVYDKIKDRLINVNTKRQKPLKIKK